MESRWPSALTPVDPFGFQRLLQESLAWPPPMDVWQMIAAVSPMDLCGMAMAAFLGRFVLVVVSMFGGKNRNCFPIFSREKDIHAWDFNEVAFPIGLVHHQP